jgi:hypothetical protein
MKNDIELRINKKINRVIKDHDRLLRENYELSRGIKALEKKLDHYINELKRRNRR